jgi:uncharacterized protein YndB with AHSA1/START domain
MNDRIEREARLDAPVEDVWEAVLADGWLAEEVILDLRPGGEALFTSGEEVRSGWIEEVSPPERLAFWWAADGEPASRVELTLIRERDTTRLRICETRPLELLDLVGIPLGRVDGGTFGPALVAA